jgi:hypothetical protein
VEQELLILPVPTTVGSKVLLTEYTLFKSKKELFLADSKYKQNVININILSKNLAEEGCSTIHASDDADAFFPHS